MAPAAGDPAADFQRMTMAHNLSKSGAVQGMTLTGLEGAKLGTIRELFLDLETGGVEFIVVEAASLLGGSGKFYPIPWTAVRYGTITGAFNLAMAKDAFKSAPSYDREQLATLSHGWPDQSVRYFAPQAEEG